MAPQCEETKMLTNPLFLQQSGGENVTVELEDITMVYGGFIVFWNEQTGSFQHSPFSGFSGGYYTYSVPSGTVLLCVANGSDNFHLTWKCDPSDAADMYKVPLTDQSTGASYSDTFNTKLYRVNSDCKLFIDWA